ncbi:chemotaxis protein CheA [Cellulomonas gilvus]|uniref:histidine kinase n=1 Tax=Cellulomonas gilvus (strain ATCC 13127 / NRRL B-14078) TaxID=593907 RepID=F8A5Z0_CELGA|nr:chemotaxis protein CheA [Cellulomonas gilvus]AEI11005.1 CheA signal transduction histidine kinase [Cellulomonas gilvus ATCC 13127]
MDEIDEIVREFLVESHENLDQLDSDLVALEETPDSRALLSSVFRTIHTIKGTSGFLAFSRLERVAHVGENLLVDLRDGRRSMDQPTTDVLLLMVDTVRELLGAIERTGGEGDVDVEPAVAALVRVQAGEPAAPAAPEAAAPAAPPAEPEVPTAPEEAAAPAEAVAPEEVAVPAEVPAEPAAPAAQPVAEVPAPAAPAAPAAVLPSQRPDPTPLDETGTLRGAADSSIRVDVELLDQLMRQVGELVLARNRISRLANSAQDVDLSRGAQQLNLIASELQEGVMRTRMQPIEHVWSKMPRVVRDLAALCGREVRLEMVGGDTELDRSLLEAVKDPLTHLVRNAVDHGIEPPEARVAAGKPAQGLLELRASHAGGQVAVEVRDDGRGIDPEVVGAKAIAKGLRTAEQVAAMSPNDLLQLLFLPGFSTAEKVTNVSGRGVGMDVVRTRIEAIGGTVDVESTIGAGTVWRLRIPLTLAIMPSLSVECAGDLYALPQVHVVELVALDTQRSDSGVEYVHAAPVYRLRGELLPLVSLAGVLGVAADDDRPAVIAVVQADQHRFGMLVDRVLTTEEIVVTPLAARLKAIGIYSGATVLGDGRVALILDVQAIARRAITRDSELAARAAAAAESATVRAEVEQVLVAGIGGSRRVAMPLASVARLEHVRAEQVELVGGREVVQYRGTILPLVRLDRLLGTYARESDELLLVVYTRGSRSVGLVVEEIVDIVEDEVGKHSSIDDAGLTGSTVLGDKVTELLDVRSAILAADRDFYTDPVPADVFAGLDELVGATR